MKWLMRGLVVVAASHIVLFIAVAAAMLRPPEQFGQVMRYLPEPLVWGALPAPRMWLWARSGRLTEGAEAPDFTLWTYDHKAQVTLSSHRGQRPVVLVFGSYT